MAEPKSPLSDEDLLALLRKEEQAAAAFQDGTLAGLRRQALAYYDRQPYGDEQEGASQVVTSEFADVIESIMPGLMRVFTAADDLVRFTPAAPGHEKWAEEASAYVPHVLMRQNDGFRIISGLLKDALMYRLSGVTVDVEEVDETRTLPVQGVPQDAIDLVAADAERRGGMVTLDLELDGIPSEAEGPLFLAPTEFSSSMPGEQCLSGTISLTHCRKRVVVENIAPEDIRFSPGARTEDKASFLGFIKRTTASELAKLGLSAEEIDALSADRPTSTRRSSATRAWWTANRAAARTKAAGPTASARCGWSWPTSAPISTATASPSWSASSMPMAAPPAAASSSARPGRDRPQSRWPRQS